MPSTRYSFSCNTKSDWDIIQWLDSFNDSRERTIVVRTAVRYYMNQEELADQPMATAESIRKFQNTLDSVWLELQKISESGVAVTITSAPDNTTAPQITLTAEQENEAVNNLLDFMGE